MNKISDFIARLTQLAEASNTLDNAASGDMKNDLAVTPNIKYFIKKAKTLESKVKARKERKKAIDTALKETKQQMENLEKLGNKIDKILEANAGIDYIYAATVAGSYEVEEGFNTMGETMALFNSTPMSNDKEFQEILKQFESMKERPKLVEQFSSNRVNETFTEAQTNTGETTNIRFINPKSNISETTDLTGAEYVLALQLIMIEKIINVAAKIKCLPNENLALHYLVKFSEQEFYDCSDHDFIKGLDQFSQGYIKKVYKAHLRKPNQVNICFLQLAATVAITYSNFKKMQQVCLFIQKQIETRYAAVLEEVKRKYPGIKALHEHKTLQWKFTASIDNTPRKHDFNSCSENTTTGHELTNYQEYTQPSITTSKIVESTIANILMKDDYDFEENLDLLVFCLKQINKGIDKLLKAKLISTVNHIWEHNKPTDEFFSCILFIEKHQDLIIELTNRIENHPNFHGWQ